jgi:hypothetical protein
MHTQTERNATEATEATEEEGINDERRAMNNVILYSSSFISLWQSLWSLYYKPAESCNLDKNFGTEGSRESKEGRTILFFSASSAASCKVF